jgi:hypothetical protein
MSSGANAFSSQAGFNQSGGAHYIVLTSLEASTGTAIFVNTISAAPTGSGGATVAPTLALTTMANVIGSGTTAANAAGFVAAGKIIKDMGRSIVSAGRVFRKFAPVVQGIGANNTSSFGVVGAAGTTLNAGEGTFYLEVGREGSGASQATNVAGSPAPILRYF